jgi:hypothetical protein
MTLGLLVCCAGMAHAQYDFQAALDNMEATLQVATLNAWSTTVWQYVVPNPPGSAPWAQLAPRFYDIDNTGDGIDDDDLLAMLQLILNDDPCTRALIGDAKMDQVQAAFAANQARVDDFELSLCLQIMDTSRIDAQTKSLSVNNAPIRMANTVLTTGAEVTLPLQVQYLFLWWDVDTKTTVPSLWGPGGILDAAAPGFGATVRDLLAAYITIGDPNGLDYMQAVMAQTIARGVLPNIMELILGGIKSGKSASEPMLETGLPGKDGEKYYVIPALSTINIDRTYNPPFHIDISSSSDPPDTEWINIRRIVARLDGPCVTSGLNTWMANYKVDNTNGFTSLPTLLAATGNLNGDANTNLYSYANIAGRNRTIFLEEEHAAYPTPLTLALQPIGTGAPIPYGGTPKTLTVAVRIGDDMPYAYQWYRGLVAGDLSPISGATAASYIASSTVPGNWYYRCDVSTLCGTETTASNEVLVQVLNPPITFSAQPAGATLTWGAAYNGLSVTAAQQDGTLTYQWQQDPDGGGPLPLADIPGATGSSYPIASANFSHRGTYRCVVTSTTFGNTANSNQVSIDVSSPTPSISQHPADLTLEEGQAGQLVCDATIAGSGSLTFQWERNGVPVTGVIPGPGPVVYDILSMGLGDVGNYRCKITSVEFGTFKYTTGAQVSLAAGDSVRYVDKMASRPGSNPAGTTWEDAFATIQEGIDAVFAEGGGEVWVAGGPAPGGYVYNELRTELWGNALVEGSLILKDNVAVYGGFEGYAGQKEAARGQRGVRRAVTIIDGSASMGGSPAYHVVVVGNGENDTDPTIGAVLDGFDVRGGRAAGIPGDYHTFRGAGLYNWISRPVIANCTFYDNAAKVAGGAIANESFGIAEANANIQNCVFWGNLCNREMDTANNPVRGGGAMFNNMAYPTILYSTFVANDVDELAVPAGAIGLASGGILNFETRPALTISSSIFWANPDGPMETVCVLGSPTCGPPTIVASNMQAVDPAFATGGPEFFLSPGSPSINAGDPAMPAPLRDLPGAPRPQGPFVDQGAYEYTVDPIALCLAAELTLDTVTNQVTLLPSTVYDPSSSAPGGLWGMLIDGADSVLLDCSDLGVGQHTLTLIDFQGNTGTCTADVTVKDDVDPVAVCKDITVQLDATGNYTLSAGEIDNGSTDNCEPTVNLSIPPTSFDCSDIGSSTIVTLTATDSDGNFGTCTASVSVEDVTPPTVITQNISVNLSASGTVTITPDEVDGGTLDACDPAPGLALDVTTFTCADLGDNTVTLTATDQYGNAGSATATVTVNDVTAPMLALTGSNLVVVKIFRDTYAEQGAVFSDACDGTGAATPTYPAPITGDGWVPQPGDEGLYTITYNYTDGSGNAATPTTRQVQVIANFAPTLTLSGSNPYYLQCNEAYVDPGATASDVEDGDLTSEIVAPPELPIPPSMPGATFTLTYTVTDHDPNNPLTTVATRTVIVVDNLVPMLTLLGDDLVGVQVGDTSYVDAGATALDDCEGDLTASIVVDDPVDINVSDVYTVTYTVQDSSGNAAAPVTRTVWVGDLLHFVIPPASQDAYVDDAPFQLNATWAGGLNTYAYEWFRNGSSVGSGSLSGNTMSLTVTPGALSVGTYTYFAEVTDTLTTVISESAQVVIGDHISLTPLADDEVVPDNDFSLSVTATGGIGALSYEWQKFSDAKAWTVLADGGNISGTSTSTLFFTPFVEGDDGQYRVVVSDLYESVESNVATITEGTGVPLAGGLGLAALAALSALGGALAIRRRK